MARDLIRERRERPLLVDRSFSSRFKDLQRQIDRLTKRVKILEGVNSPDVPPDSPDAA